MDFCTTSGPISPSRNSTTSLAPLPDHGKNHNIRIHVVGHDRHSGRFTGTRRRKQADSLPFAHSKKAINHFQLGGKDLVNRRSLVQRDSFDGNRQILVLQIGADIVLSIELFAIAVDDFSDKEFFVHGEGRKSAASSSRPWHHA